MTAHPPPPGPGPSRPPTPPEPATYDAPPAYPPAYAQPYRPAPRGPRTPPAGLGYHQIHRGGAWGANGWWRPLVGVMSMALLMLLVVPMLLVVVFLVGYAIAGEPLQSSFEALTDTGNVTPVVLVFLNLSLAAGIPVVWLLQRTLHGLRPGWLSSVFPRLRWRWLGICFGLSLVALVATLVVSALLPDQGGPASSGEVNAFTSTTRDFLLVVVLLTPLQAAGEEYIFRGYLTQSLGGLVRSPRLSMAVAVFVPAVLFALAHGAQDAPIFFDRFAFGLSAGVLVILTGGLEAGIAMHVLNNWLAFGLALAFGDMTSSLNPTGGTWWSIPVTLTQSLVFLGLCVWTARGMGIDTRTREGVLAASGARV